MGTGFGSPGPDDKAEMEVSLSSSTACACVPTGLAPTQLSCLMVMETTMSIAASSMSSSFSNAWEVTGAAVASLSEVWGTIDEDDVDDDDGEACIRGAAVIGGDGWEEVSDGRGESASGFCSLWVSGFCFGVGETGPSQRAWDEDDVGIGPGTGEEDLRRDPLDGLVRDEAWGICFGWAFDGEGAQTTARGGEVDKGSRLTWAALG